MTDPLHPLKEYDHWVEWGRDGDSPKRPYSPDGHPTGHNSARSSQWGSFDETWEERGFVLTGTPFWGIDVDDVAVDEEGGGLVCTKGEPHNCDVELAEAVLHTFNGESYWERSPSGEGYHMIARDEGCPDADASKGAHVEVYATNRYLTVTGDELEEASSGEVADIPVERARRLFDIHAPEETESEGAEPPQGGNDLDDTEVVAKIRDSEQAEKFEHLFDQGNVRGYPSQSEADQALCNILAFWTGGDAEQMDLLFRTSALMRDKWKRDDYREDTIRNAIESCHGFYGVDDWGTARWMFGNEDISTPSARAKAYDVLTAEHHFMALKDTEELYRYDPEIGIYLADGDQFVSEVLERELGEFYTRHTRNELVDRLKAANWTEREDVGASPEDPKVCVENGVLNLRTLELTEHSPDERFIRRLPVAYDPDADNPAVDAFLDDVVAKEEDKDCIYEIIGHCLFPGFVKDSIVILFGDGRNGKTTLLDLLQALLGPENTSNNTLQELASDDFAIADLYGKMANICGDLPADTIHDTGLIKQLSGGDRVRANPKHETPFYFKNEAQLVFAANSPPQMEDETTAMSRRLVPLSMPHEFTPPGQPGPDQVPRHELMGRLTDPEELSGTLNMAIEGLHRLMDGQNWSGRADAVAEVREHYAKISDPFYAFVNDCVRETANPDDYVSKTELYTTYNRWAGEEGTPLKKASVLGQELPKHMSMASSERKRIGGERVQVYTSVQLSSRGEQLSPKQGNATEDQSQL